MTPISTNDHSLSLLSTDDCYRATGCWRGDSPVRILLEALSTKCYGQPLAGDAQLINTNNIRNDTQKEADQQERWSRTG